MPSIALESQSILRGESFDGRLAVTEDGSAKDLTGASVRWALYSDGASPVLGPYMIGAGIAFEGASTLGVVQVSIPETDTSPLPAGHYRQEWAFVDSLGATQKWTGRFLIGDARLDPA